MRRLGPGPCILLALVGFTLGNALIPLAPSGAVLLAVAFLVGQQLIGDFSATIDEITEMTFIQSTVPNELLGRVSGTYDVLTHVALLVGTIGGGVIGEWIGLRQALVFGLLGGVVAVAVVWFSPLRSLREMPASPGAVGGPVEEPPELPLTE